jgi:hypothetical protein
MAWGHHPTGGVRRKHPGRPGHHHAHHVTAVRGHHQHHAALHPRAKHAGVRGHPKQVLKPTRHDIQHNHLVGRIQAAHTHHLPH